MEPDIDPAKLFQRAPEVLNMLSDLSRVILAHWRDCPPEVQMRAGNAVALIFDLQKSVDIHKQQE